MKNFGSLALASTLALSGCDGCIDTPQYGSLSYVMPIEETPSYENEGEGSIDEGYVELEIYTPQQAVKKAVANSLDGGKADGSKVYSGKKIEVKELMPPKTVIIPPAPKGTKFRMVNIQLVGTRDLSTVPQGYLGSVYGLGDNGEIDDEPSFGVMISRPTLEGTTFVPPRDTKEIAITADKFVFYWTKHPGMKTRLPFPKGIINK